MRMKEKISQELKKAIKSREDVKKSTIRLILAAVKNREIEKRGEIDDDEILGIIQKEVKTRREVIDEAQNAGRTDLVREAETEIAILEEFLPKQLSEKELNELIDEVIADTGATSIREMGKVMGALMPRVRGRADGKRVSELVRQQLQGD